MTPPLVRRAFALLIELALAACSPSSESPDAGPPPPACPEAGQGALSICMGPNEDASYYVAQALDYFDTIDVSVAAPVEPNYSPLVARWEWPPWLQLTGYGFDNIESLDSLLRTGDPSSVPVRDCRAFGSQPFARCRISFDYDGGMCPIYEEFTFNDLGQTTFIEAWSDEPGMLPMADAGDLWGEGDDVHRLSTKLPGLGDLDGGLIQLDAGWMLAAAKRDPDIANFVARANNFWGAWLATDKEAGATLFQRGCGWTSN